MGDVLTINRNPGDFVKDTQHLTTLEIGAYQMICDQIVTRGQDSDPPSIADDDVMMANIVRLSLTQWRKVRPRLCEGDAAVLSVANGRVFQLRLAFEIEEAQRRIKGQSAKGRRSGEVRRAKADLKRRFLEGTKREPEVNRGSSPVQTGGEPEVEPFMSHESLESKSLPQQSLRETEREPAVRPRKPKAEPSEIDAAFERLWLEYPRRLGKADARRHFGAQVKPGDMPAIESAIRNYKRNIAILATDEQYVLHGSSFFNHKWRDYADGTWKQPEPPQRPGHKIVNEGPPEAPHHPRFVS